MADSCHI